MNIGMWIGEATRELREIGVDSAQLDGEILLAHTIKHPRTYLHAHLDEQLDARTEEIANARLDLRKDRVPVAYIIGHKEFYGRRFTVSPSVLIPRPESEEIIELLSAITSNTHRFIDDTATNLKLVDIGTGSGCLGITAKLEHPEYETTLVDVSKPALAIAEKNANSLGADITILKSNLLDAYPYKPDVVLANLPYVDTTWESSKEIEHEPQNALFASRNGLSIIQKCFEQLSVKMDPSSYAIFEADPRQWEEIERIALANGFKKHRSLKFAASFEKN
jgi:release factor glutamine methyltransferase